MKYIQILSNDHHPSWPAFQWLVHFLGPLCLLIVTRLIQSERFEHLILSPSALEFALEYRDFRSHFQ